MLLTIALLSGCSETEMVEDTALLDTTWNLVSLNGESIQRPEPSQAPYLLFSADEVTGFDGCNQFFGPYTLDGDRLTFGPLISTQIACLDIGDLDIRYMQMLRATNRFRIDANRLRLLEDETQLASFIAAEQL